MCEHLSSRGEYLVFDKRKAWLTLICWLGPEFLLFLSDHQWQSARRSVRDFRDLGFEKWSLKHAFFADMGGFVLRTSDDIQFPLTSKHLHFLIAKDFITRDYAKEYIIVDEKVIEDKNKADDVVRIITVGQTLWFLTNCIARAIQGLAVTTIELTVCAFITTTVPVVYFWFQKPADIGSSFIIKCQVTVPQIRERYDKESTKDWYRTPLSFLDLKETWLSLGWTYFVNIVRHMTTLQLFEAPDYRCNAMKSIPDDHFGDMTPGPALTLQAFVTAACFAINISAWNFWFPTETERTLWRVASIVMASSVYWGAFVNMWIVPTLTKCRVFEWLDASFTSRIDRIWKGRGAFAALLRNNHPDKDPAFTVPLRVIIPGFFIAVSYCLARAYLLVEDLVILRLQPPSTYETVNWTAFLPHV